MLDMFEGMLVGEKLEAHGKSWYRIKQLQHDLDQGHTMYLAVEIGASLPSPVKMIAVPIEAKELARLRESEAKHQAHLEAMKGFKPSGSVFVRDIAKPEKKER
jgi:hypothetical protein